jgi:hypothetical protein
MAKSNKLYSPGELIPLARKYLLNAVADEDAGVKATANLPVSFWPERELLVPFERSHFADAATREPFRGMRINQ